MYKVEKGGTMKRTDKTSMLLFDRRRERAAVVQHDTKRLLATQFVIDYQPLCALFSDLFFSASVSLPVVLYLALKRKYQMFVKLVHLERKGTLAWGKTQRPRTPTGKSENVSWYILFFFAIIITRNKIVLIVPVSEKIRTKCQRYVHEACMTR